MTTQTLSASDLMAELRAGADGDWWGTTMSWWFAVAGEMWERSLPIPDEWRYRPSPFGGKDPDAFEAEICEQATDEALRLFGRAMNRYAAILKKAGKDY
jgi:hypothetical protein